MKSTYKSNAFRPFKNLRSIMKRHEISSIYPSPPKSPDNLEPKHQSPESDRHVFLKAMEGVAPIDRNNIVEKSAPSINPITKENEDSADREAIEKLKALIQEL